MTEVLNASPETTQTVVFESDITLLGLIAVHYGKQSSLAPIRGFGGDIENRQYYDKATDTWYSIGDVRRGGVGGVAVSYRATQTATPYRTVWFPYSSLRLVSTSIEGCIVE